MTMTVMVEMKTSGEALVMRNFALKASDNTKLYSIGHIAHGDTAKAEFCLAVEGSRMS